MVLFLLFCSVHVVFGRVVSGSVFVTEIENQKVDTKNRPYADVRITNCGQLVLMKSKLWNRITKYIYIHISTYFLSSIHPPIVHVFMSIHAFIISSIYLSHPPFIHLSIYPFNIQSSVDRIIHPFITLSIHSFISSIPILYLFIYLSI